MRWAGVKDGVSKAEGERDGGIKAGGKKGTSSAQSISTAAAAALLATLTSAAWLLRVAVVAVAVVRSLEKARDRRGGVGVVGRDDRVVLVLGAGGRPLPRGGRAAARTGEKSAWWRGGVSARAGAGAGAGG